MSSGAPPRICFYSIAAHLGGAERSLLDLVVGLKDAGRYTPWILLPKAEGELVDALKKNEIAHSALAMPEAFFRMSREKPIEAGVRAVVSTPLMPLYLARLASLVRRERPSLIHTTGIKCHGLSAMADPFTNVPVLWHLRDIMRPGVTLSGLRALRRLSHVHVIANSNATAKAFDPSDQTIETIYNGLDETRFKPSKNDRYRSIFKTGSKTPVIGIIGVLARWKGQLEFLRMAKSILDSGADARFVIIGAKIYDTSGDEDFEAILKSAAAELGLSKHVHFAGFEKDSVLAINGLDIVVHASTRPEPFGRVAIESMACGVPVVGAGAGGILEILRDGETGLLFRPGDTSDMTQATLKLIREPALRERIAERGRADFLKRFTVGAYVNGVTKKYDEILRSGARDV